MYRYSAKLHQIIDGDTVDLIVDLGFHVSIKERFRLAGIDAPERGTEGGTNATLFLRELMLSEGHTDLLLESAGKDKYGRWLGKIYFKDSTESVNDAMIREGHAKPYDGGKR